MTTACPDEALQPPQAFVKLVFDCFASDSVVVEKALKQLADLTSDGRAAQDARQNCAMIDRIGGPLVIVQSMEKHIGTKDIQKDGCRALANLALLETSNRHIAEVGGIEGIVAAMKTYPAHSGLQEQGCFALASLSNGKPKTRHIMKETGAASVIIKAMKRHSGNANLQYAAFQALNELTNNGDDGMKQFIVRKGGLSVIQKMAKEHSKRVGVKAATDDLLAKLARGIPTE